MAKHSETLSAKAAPAIGQMQAVAEQGYEAAKRAVESASGRVDDLSRFGKQRPLLAMGVAFLTGFFVAKTFF